MKIKWAAYVVLLRLHTCGMHYAFRDMDLFRECLPEATEFSFDVVAAVVPLWLGRGGDESNRVSEPGVTDILIELCVKHCIHGEQE